MKKRNKTNRKLAIGKDAIVIRLFFGITVIVCKDHTVKKHNNYNSDDGDTEVKH